MHTSIHDQSLQSAALELKYERSQHLVDIISKDESVRKLRFEVHVLEDDCDELRDLLAKEEDRSEKLEKIVNDNLGRAEEAEAAVQELDDNLAIREQELSTLRAERKALKNLTTDSNKIMTEKLELTRELSQLKPELEHLKAQVASNEGLLTEKLALQRQVSNLEVEVESAKRDAQRALAKRRNTMHEVAQEDEMESLRKTVKQEKRQREKAEATIQELQTELEEQKKAAQRATVQETKKAAQGAEVEVRSEELSRELAQEKKEKVKAERALQKAQSDWEAQRAVLDDKLNQFRNKLRTTKEQLKESQTALTEAQEAAAAAPKPTKKTSTTADKPKQVKKRNAAQMDPDATTLGTPGNGGAAKRSRKVTTVGEKSSFSITPFLNRTTNVAPSSPNEEGEEEEHAEAEAEATPTAKPSRAKKAPLQPIPSSKTNIKKAASATDDKTQQKKKVRLEQVAEEEDEDNNDGAASKEAEQAPVLKQKAPTLSKPKIRKSLATFATFNLEPEPEKKANKKRKLGGLGKTLFDEDDEDDRPSKPLPGRGLFGIGKLGPLGGAAASMRGGLLKVGGKKGLLATEDGFQFSPLKKQRREMSILQ